MSRVEPTADRTPKSRLGVSDAMKKNAKGAVKTAIEILSVAAAMTQNVPYLGFISGVLDELLKIYNEIEVLKSDWKTTAHITEQIKSVIDDVHARCQSNNIELPEVMVKPLEELEQSVLVTLEILIRCRAGSKHWKDRARTLLSRGDLVDDVRQCRARMQAALDLFAVKLMIGQAFTMDATSAGHRQIGTQSQTPPEPTTTITGSVSLPSAPAIFHGRDQEVSHAVDLLINKSPARVAILGSGGIGKTSVALAALHNPEVEALYGDRRFFLSCEAVNSADGIVQELLKTFGVVVGQGRSPQDVLLSHMRTLSDGLLCLDNLETPWDDDTLAVESLLAQIAALPRLALLVTTRGANRPLQVAWTQPFLPQIVPLTFNAALKTWDAICGFHDAYAERLIAAVDCVPLAVTLLAHLAESEPSEDLWARWERDLTDLVRVHGPDHRLSSVDISVRLSLHGPRLRDDKSTVQFFSVLCTLPQGMRQSRIPVFIEAYAKLLPDMRRSIALLKQCALASSAEDGFLRVLSPVRHHMQAHHPITTTPLFRCLAVIYRDVVQDVDEDWAVRASYAKKNIQPELGNIATVLRLCLTFEVDDFEQTADSIVNFYRLCNTLSIHDSGLLSEAISHCSKRRLPAVKGKLWLWKGKCLYYQNHARDSLMAYERALELYRSVGDRAGEAVSLKFSGDSHAILGQYREAERSLSSAQSLYNETGDQLGKANSLCSLGDLYMRLGRLEEAERVLSSAQTLFDEIGDRLGKASSMHFLGNLYVRLGQLDGAEWALSSAQTLFDEIGNRLGKANSLKSLGYLYMRLGRLDEAERALSSAHTLYDEIRHRLGKANCLKWLGNLYVRLRRIEDAERALSSAQTLYDEIGYRLGKANSLQLLGNLYMQLGRLHEAEQAMSSAQTLFNEIGSRLGMANSLGSLGNLYMRFERLDEAERALSSAQSLYGKIGARLGKANSLRSLGDLYVRLERLDEAERALLSAQTLYDEIGDRLGKVNCLVSLGDVCRRLLRHDEAIVALKTAEQLSRDVPYAWGQEEAQRQIGLVYADHGEFDELDRDIEEESAGRASQDPDHIP